MALSTAKSRFVSAGSGSTSRHATGELSGGGSRGFGQELAKERTGRAECVDRYFLFCSLLTDLFDV
jgi:hypothetical protein